MTEPDVTEPALAALSWRAPIEQPTALVVAHPDDETIGAGASLHLFTALLLVHVTDGAPRNGADARAAGFATLGDYAGARRRELAAALAVAGFTGARVELGLPDQGASADLPALAHRLAALFAAHGIRLVLTHAYEGGHPDHDATACAVHAAASRTVQTPAILEVAGYHASGDGGMAVGGFLPNGAAPTVVALDTAERARKRAMLDCFATQRATLASFGTRHEAFRPAPHYDFSAAPHPGRLHYERYDWGMTGARWRTLAGARPATPAVDRT